jgi:K+-transporting ATPase ATPase C chain
MRFILYEQRRDAFVKDLIRELRISTIATLSLAVILCGLYPLIVWVLAQGLFPAKANGSLVERDGITIGSALLSQGFAHPKYFHPRPSAAGEGYDAIHSGGSNLGPTSKALIDTVRRRVEEYRRENHLTLDARVPADAVTTSASGLDPHISVENALLQAPRVAKTRGLSQEVVLKEIKNHTAGRNFGILGEPRVNVLLLNLALDRRR